MEEEKKKTTFLFVFSTFLPVFLLKFQLGELVGCEIKFFIQRLPTPHTFDGPHCPKNKKCMKNVMMTSSSHFSGISCFWGRGPIKIMPSGYSLDAEFNSTFNELSQSKFEKKHREICRKYEQKSSFLFSSSKINKHYSIILTIILLIFLRRPILS